MQITKSLVSWHIPARRRGLHDPGEVQVRRVVVDHLKSFLSDPEKLFSLYSVGVRAFAIFERPSPAPVERYIADGIPVGPANYGESPTEARYAFLGLTVSLYLRSGAEILDLVFSRDRDLQPQGAEASAVLNFVYAVAREDVKLKDDVLPPRPKTSQFSYLEEGVIGKYRIPNELQKIMTTYEQQIRECLTFRQVAEAIACSWKFEYVNWETP